MKMTIYVPDDLAAQVKTELSDVNVSAICQAALRAELRRTEARAALGPDDFERIQLDIKSFNREPKSRPIAFQGRELAHATYHDQTAWITPKGVIVVHDGHNNVAWSYAHYGAFAADGQPAELATGVAVALGKEYVEELEI